MKNCKLRYLRTLLRLTLVFIAALAALAPRARAQTAAFTPLQSFHQTIDGVQPVSPLVLGGDGNFYGVTNRGGTKDAGVVFKVTPAGVQTIFFDFASDPKGFHPLAGLVFSASDGSFYGTTSQGGDFGAGSFFELNAAGVLTTLYSFNGPTDGSAPAGTLTEGADGNLYGICASGGANNVGTIYKITKGGGFSLLHAFGGFVGGNNTPDGELPFASLCKGGDNNFYGVTSNGGANGVGIAFSITPDGSTYSLLHSFGAGGAFPAGALVELSGSPGVFMGVTSDGGTHGAGIVFQISASTSFSDVHDFNPDAGEVGNPFGGLTVASDGLFYGMAGAGGANSAGGIYATSPLGGFSLRHSFDTPSDLSTTDFTAGLTAANSGNLFFGVTQFRGANNQGAVFTMTLPGVLTPVHDFVQGGNAHSVAGLVRDASGNLYGTTTAGGTSNLGTLFKLSPTGALTTLHNFSGVNGLDSSGGTNDGATPSNGPLVLASDGNLYGTTSSGGANNLGTVFEFNPDGDVTTLHSFGNNNGSGVITDGSTPLAGLTASGGSFFGVTLGGGTNGLGEFFSITPAGVFSALGSVQPGDGFSVQNTLALGGDGNFYGSAAAGGANGDGAIFSFTPTGAERLVRSFSALDNNGFNSDGGIPAASLLEGASRLFFGTAEGGGANGTGTIFTVTPEGVLNPLYSFSTANAGVNADGLAPQGLTKGSDGNFYGCAINGGANRSGTLFVITPAGKLTVLHAFAALGSGSMNAEGGDPVAPLLETTNGIFVGTTRSGGAGGVGAIFSMTVSPAITSAAAAMGVVGQAFSYQITATNSPTSFAADSLPPGLGVNTSTGLVSGTPTAAGTFVFQVGASNNGGADQRTVILTVKPPPPVITSPLTASGDLGDAFSYQITATNSPTSFAADNLPFPLSVNTTTGLISGPLGVTGTVTFQVAAANAGGSDEKTVTLTVNIPFPVITSPSTASAEVGHPFSFQITISEPPKNFMAAPLPPGLSLDATTGLISGTPTAPGVYFVTLNVQGTFEGAAGSLMLTVTAQQPTITFSSPPADLTVFAGAHLPLAAEVSDPDGVLSQVQFFVGTTLIGTANAAPFAVDFTAPAAGAYTLSAVATDTEGRQSTASRTLTTLASAFGPPTVNLLTGGADGLTVAASTTLTLDYSITTTDPAAPLDRVDFYANGAVFSSLDAAGNVISGMAPDSVRLMRKDAAAGTSDFRVTFTLPSSNNAVNLVAVARDKLGRSQVSQTITVTSAATTTNRPPTVSVGLSDGVFVRTNQAVTVPATAADADANASLSLAKVDYFVNGVMQKEDTQAPFGFSFTPATAGIYVVTAVATDAGGLSTVSAPVRLQAAAPPTVSVKVKGSRTVVEGGAKATILFSRDSFLTEDLTVKYKIKGTAKNGVDYKTLSGSIVIPAGAASAKLKIKPINNLLVDGTRTVTLRLRASATDDYEIDNTALKATIKIRDND